MKKEVVCHVLAGLFCFGLVSAAQAGPVNITIWDGSGVTFEDNEVEPGNVQGQEWDLEAFMLDGSELTMVGGFDFMNGQVGNNIKFTSGDIFISTSVPPKDPPSYNSSPGYNTYLDETFGYDYVLDINWDNANGTFDLVKLDNPESNLELVGAYYNENENNPTSNPWQYKSGGLILGSYSFGSMFNGDSYGFNGWNGNNTHNAVSFDLAPLYAALGPDVTELYFHFTMGCGNDNLMGYTDYSPVPEPTTALLFGAGLAGLAGLYRRKR